MACCVDREGAPERTLAEAARIARLSGARLSVVHVVESPDAFTGGRTPWSPPEQDIAAGLVADAQGWLEPLTGRLGADAVVLEGDDPPAEVAAWAQRADCDLIVICPRRGAIVHAILGSFASRVVREAPCPVLLVTESAPA